MSEMNLGDLKSGVGELFITISKASIMAHDCGVTRGFFIKFCESVWDTMMNEGIENFTEMLESELVEEFKNCFDKRE